MMRDGDVLQTNEGLQTAEVLSGERKTAESAKCGCVVEQGQDRQVSKWSIVPGRFLME